MFNLQHMPSYFKNLQCQALKQLNEDDVKSIIKSRHICEARLERASDLYKFSVNQKTRAVRTQNIL
jgi:hypothetical protein